MSFQAFWASIKSNPTLWVQIPIAISALGVSTAAIIYSVAAWNDDKNARLVEIGVAVLRADPKKEPSAAYARKWALDLIDANAGRVKFSPEARATLLEQPLPGDIWGSGVSDIYGGGNGPVYGGGTDSIHGGGVNRPTKAK